MVAYAVRDPQPTFMTQSTLARYRNLVANIANWPRYFTRKLGRTFVPVRFTTTGRPLRFEVPTRGLYLVFKEIFLSDFYSIRRLTRALPSAPAVVDVGANAGYFCMLLLSKVPAARVYAYEPIAENRRIFERNMALNPSLSSSVSLRGEAVTGRPAESVELFREPGASSVTASAVSGFAALNTEPVRVPAITLSDVLRKHGLTAVDLLKLDCEGSEYPIVYDSPRGLWPTVRAIVLEVHDLDDGTRNAGAMRRYLESMGYTCSSDRAVNGCTSLYARRA